MTTPTAVSEYANGTMNMQSDFPAPVAIFIIPSFPWSAGSIASSCLGLSRNNLPPEVI